MSQVKIFKINISEDTLVGAVQISACLKGMMSLSASALDVTEEWNRLKKLEAIHPPVIEPEKVAPSVQEVTPVVEPPVAEKVADQVAESEQETAVDPEPQRPPKEEEIITENIDTGEKTSRVENV